MRGSPQQPTVTRVLHLKQAGVHGAITHPRASRIRYFTVCDFPGLFQWLRASFPTGVSVGVMHVLLMPDLLFHQAPLLNDRGNIPGILESRKLLSKVNGYLKPAFEFYYTTAFQIQRGVCECVQAQGYYF